MKVLFVSLSNIGDAIMTTPVLHALEEKYPEAVFDIVAGKRSAEVFSHYPKKRSLYIKDKQGFLRGYYDLWKSLIKTRYDLIVDLRFDGFIYLLRGKKRLSKRDGNQALSHAVEQHMSVISRLVNSRSRHKLELYLKEGLNQFALDAIAELPNGVSISIGPGCGGPEKVWQAEKFAETCNRLKDKLAAVILLGGPGDKDYCRAVSEKLLVPHKDFSGKTSILEAAALIKNTNCFIGNDSGLGHLASAVNTPTVTLFGVGFPERYHPWQERAEWLLGDDQEVNNISVDDVVAAVKKVWSK